MKGKLCAHIFTLEHDNTEVIFVQVISTKRRQKKSFSKSGQTLNIAIILLKAFQTWREDSSTVLKSGMLSLGAYMQVTQKTSCPSMSAEIQ